MVWLTTQRTCVYLHAPRVPQGQSPLQSQEVDIVGRVDGLSHAIDSVGHWGRGEWQRREGQRGGREGVVELRASEFFVRRVGWGICMHVASARSL